MGGHTSKDKSNQFENDFVIEYNTICLICKKKKAEYAYSSCGHNGLCKECNNIILGCTTCSIKCPICQKMA